MDKVPEGPLGAAGAAKPKLLVGKLETSLKREREAICHDPLQHLGDAREEADRAVPFGEARVPARFGHCQNLCVWEFRSSLGVAIGRAALARPRTGTSEPFGRGPVPGGLGRIAVTVPMS